jgi:hypothetical protein
MPTVDASSIVGGGSGNTGWSAKSTFLVPSIDQHNREGAVETGFGPAFAQSFTTGPAQELTDVWVYLARSNSPTDNHWIEIETDNGSGLPSGTVIATSNILDPSTVSAYPTYNWYRFTFASPPSLSAGTKYHIHSQRTTVDATHFLYWKFDDTGSYSGGSLAQFTAGSWTHSGVSAFDMYFITVAGERLYQVTQDAELHVWESSNDGSSWTELDAGNGPAVNSSTKPFSADARNDAVATTVSSDITCVLFTGTNTIRGWDTRLWDTTALQNADASTDADFNRNVRVIARADETVLFYTSVADDADLEYVRRTTGAWGAQTQTLVLGDTEASSYSDVVKDAGGFSQMFWYDCNANDFVVRSLIGTTLGTATAVDSSAADVETEQASANYHVYDPGTETVIAAYIDSDASIQERTAQLEVTSASITFGTEHAVGTLTTSAGRSLATCKFGSDLYVFAGLSAGIDVYKDTGASGTWGSVENWKTGLSSAVLSTAVPIAGVGILVSYVSGGNVIVDLYTVNVPQTGTATVGTASAAGGTHTGTGVANQTGTTTVGTASAAGGTHTGTAGAGETGTATVGTASAAGGTYTGSAATTGVATVGTAPAAGGTHTGSFVAHQTGTTTAGEATATGGTHTGAAVIHETGTHTASNAAAAGGSHSGSAATIGAATVGTASAAGGTHTGDSSVVLDETGTATVGTASAAGGSHTATAGIGTTGTTTTGTASAAGGAHASTADTAGLHTTGTASATGHAATGTAGTEATGTATAGSATAAGGSHTATAQAIATATVGTATAEGFSHTGVSAAADDGIHVRGQATAEGGTHTGVVTASATTTTGTAGAAGGTHTAGYTATGEHTTGTATAAGGSHVGSAGATGAAVSGSADAVGASHTATAGATGAHVVGTATATGHDATSTIAYTGIVIVGEATATGGDHTGTADTIGLVVVGEATAEGAEHFATDDTILGDLHFRLMASKPVTFRTTVQRTLTFRQTEARVLELAAIGEYDG